jgi:hypothetical protein
MIYHCFAVIVPEKNVEWRRKWLIWRCLLNNYGLSNIIYHLCTNIGKQTTLVKRPVSTVNIQQIVHAVLRVELMVHLTR